jgi:hypothetical protein
MPRRPRFYYSKLQSRLKHYTPITSLQAKRDFACRVVCILLVISLLSATAPAAPRVIVETSQQVSADISFWLKANYVADRLWNLLTLQNKKPKPESRRQSATRQSDESKSRREM